MQTYFGDIRDIYGEVIKLDFDLIGLDFVEGRKTLELVKTNGFPTDKILVVPREKTPTGAAARGNP